MSKVKKLVLLIFLVVVAIIALISAALIISKQLKAKGDGTITIEVINLEGQEMAKKDITYYEGDTLQELIEKNFNNVSFDDTGYGPFLKAIEGYTTPADWSSYISIYVDNEYSTVGIGKIKFVDGMKITLKIESYDE